MYSFEGLTRVLTNVKGRSVETFWFFACLIKLSNLITTNATNTLLIQLWIKVTVQPFYRDLLENLIKWQVVKIIRY